jgi:hypothetical protein
MSDTTHTNEITGEKFPAKTRKRRADKKHFGFTSGVHSRFEEHKAHLFKEFNETPIDNPWYEINKKRWEDIKDKTYPIRGEEYIKYSYGNGTTKETKRRHKNEQNSI